MGGHFVLGFEVEPDASLQIGDKVENRARLLFAVDAGRTRFAALLSDDPSTGVADDAVGTVVPEPNVGLLTLAMLVVLGAGRRSRRGSTRAAELRLPASISLAPPLRVRQDGDPSSPIPSGEVERGPARHAGPRDLIAVSAMARS